MQPLTKNYNDVESYFNTLLSNPSIVDNLPQSPWTKGAPPSFDAYTRSGEYIDPVELSPLQLKAAKDILGDDPKQIFSPERKISLGVLCVGKGGGKDWWSGLIQGYVITVLLHLDDPQRYFKISGHLDLLNVAITKTQAEKVFFSYFTYFIKRNKWILNHYNISSGGRAFSKIPPETPTDEFYGNITLGSGNAIFPNDIRCQAESSQNESWEGFNVIFFVLDEISGFMSETEVANGLAIFNTAYKSCISRRTTTFKGIGLVISFPRQEKNDIIWKLYKQSLTTEWMCGVFAFNFDFRLKSTYAEYNSDGTEKTFTFVSPRFNKFFRKEDSREIGINIPIYLKEDFDLDPEGSMTAYLCIPRKTAGDWIEYPERVYACVHKDQQAIFKTSSFIETLRDEDGVEYPGLTLDIKYCMEPREIRDKYRYVAWLDAAEKHCDAVIAIARKERKAFRDKRGVETYLEVCRIVDIIVWSPKPNLPINLVNVQNFLTTEIPKYINLKEVGADQWESAALSRKLLSKGIKPIRYNLSERHYDIAKQFFYTGQVEIFDENEYMNEGEGITGIDQMLSLRETHLGPKNVSGIKKDKSDAIVGCINLLLGDDFNNQNRPLSQNIDRIATPISGGNMVSRNNPYSYNPNNQLGASPIIGSGLVVDRGIPQSTGDKKIGKPISMKS